MKSLSMILVALFAILVATPMFADAAPAQSAAGVVNINTATADQFALLPRVGVKTGERIVEYRTANGPFKKATDLMQVKGIGDKTFELISSYLAVEGKTTLSEEQRAPRKPRASKSAKSRPEASAQAQ
jgi:competence protein ComEA